MLSVQDPVAAVVDVPGSDRLKILTTGPGAVHSLYVLDLANRTPSPIDTQQTPTLSMAPDGTSAPAMAADGGRFWAYVNGGTDLACVKLANLNPIPLTTTAPISALFDIAAPHGARTLIAIHAQGTFGATVFDALNPMTALSHRDVALLLEAP